RHGLVAKTVIVTLSGTHGTGKSTNAGRCYYLLNSSGHRFSYLRHQDILDPFGFIVRRAARVLRILPNDLDRTKPVRVLWALYIIFVYCPILVGGIKIRTLLGYSTVCDRYIYDTLVGFRDNGVHVPLENLRSIMDHGAYGVLESIVPPESVPAWQCFATGKNPAKIGLFGFSYIGRDRKLKHGRATPDLGCFWDICSNRGLKVGVFNVP